MSHFMVCGNLFEVQAKYTPIKPIGKGAYGVVCSARNVDSDEKVGLALALSLRVKTRFSCDGRYGPHVTNLTPPGSDDRSMACGGRH
jgi:hypothetical protein